MNGPDHYREGSGLLASSEERHRQARDDGETEIALYEAVTATAHFLAALTAAVATSQHPDSIAWQQAINPEENP